MLGLPELVHRGGKHSCRLILAKPAGRQRTVRVIDNVHCDLRPARSLQKHDGTCTPAQASYGEHKICLQV